MVLSNLNYYRNNPYLFNTLGGYMKYYYDITLNFDEYPIPYYEWDQSDRLDNYLKLPIYHVKSIVPFIEYHTSWDKEKDTFIISDGINALAIEVIDHKSAYLSFLSYKDEDCINEIALNMEYSELRYERNKKRVLPFELRKHRFIKCYLLKMIDNANKDLLRYIYYDITGKDSNNLINIKKFLIQDINANFNDKYILLYQKMM